MPRYCIRKAKLAKEAANEKKSKRKAHVLIQENQDFRGFAFSDNPKIKNKIHGRAKARKWFLLQFRQKE